VRKLINLIPSKTHFIVAELMSQILHLPFCATVLLEAHKLVAVVVVVELYYIVIC